MKNLLFIHKQILGVALLTILSAAPLLTATAHAAPDPNPRASQSNDRRNSDYRNDRRDDYRNNDAREGSFTGVVTDVRAGNRFEVRDGNRTYTVATDSSVPRGLSVGDTVRVSGQIYGDSDVRRADVSILNNNRNDNRDNNWNDNRGGNDNSYRNYSGTVEILLPNNEFNARIDGRIYKVYATESTRDLRVGDPITIYGQLDRVVNIRNARITVDRSRDSGRDDRYDDRNRDNNWRDSDRDDRYDDTNRDDNWRPGGYDNNQREFDTYVGEVTDVKNSREFDVHIDGRTYNVYADNSTKRLSRGDIVRVSGKRVGSNDLREAQVTITRNR